MKKDKESGVISLEACIVVPMFIMIMMFIYGFFIHFMGHNIMSHALIQSSKSLSLDPLSIEMLNMAEDAAESEGGLDTLIVTLFSDLTGIGSAKYTSDEDWYNDDTKTVEEVEERFYAYLAGNSTDAEVDEFLEFIGVSDVKFSESKVVDGELTVVMTYKQEFVYDFQGLGVFDCKLEHKVKLWQNKTV